MMDLFVNRHYNLLKHLPGAWEFLEENIEEIIIRTSKNGLTSGNVIKIIGNARVIVCFLINIAILRTLEDGVFVNTTFDLETELEKLSKVIIHEVKHLYKKCLS